jgi:receptor protein-tyrosine kinase
MRLFGKSHEIEDLQVAPHDEGRDLPLRREELVMVRDPQSRVAEQFRRMRNSIQALNPDGAARSILLTSAIEGEGKTVTMLNLGLAMTELPHLRVCVVDGNRFHPSVEEYLGLPRRQGLGELLAGNLSIEAAIRHTSVERLDLVGAGAQTTDPVLNVDRVRSFLNALKRRYDYVLLDAPPVLRANHPSLLASIADGILLVVRLGMTPKYLVEEAYTMLENLGGNVLGTCATAVEEG